MINKHMWLLDINRHRSYNLDIADRKYFQTSQKVLLDSIHLEIGQRVEEPELHLLRARENNVSRKE